MGSRIDAMGHYLRIPHGFWDVFSMERAGKDRFYLFYLLVLVAILVFGGTDVILELPGVIDWWHKVVEVARMILALFAITYVVFVYRRKERVLEEAQSTIGHQMEEINEWKKRHSNAVREMTEAIREQFMRRGLSESEEQVASLLIRGVQS